MRKAGKLSVGEQGAGQAARGGKAKLILLAADASPNALDRAEGFAKRAGVPLVRMSVAKAELAAALSPSEVVSVTMLEDGKSCQVIVPDSQLSLAIGKEGQNARLAAKLTGYKIDIKPASQV